MRDESPTDPEIIASIGRFREALKLLSLSQAEMAARIGTSQPHLSAILSGKRGVSPVWLLQSCVKLGLDPHAIDERFTSTKQRSGFKPGQGPKKKPEIVGDSV